MNLEWNDDYLIGFKFIDDQHKKIFSYLNQLTMVREEKYELNVSTAIFKSFLDFFSYHLSIENDLCKCYNFPKYNEVKKEHDDYLLKIQQTYNDLESHNIDKLLLTTIVLFQKEVIHHILKSDKEYVNFILDKINNK